MPRVFSPEQLAKGIKGFGDKALEDLAGREEDIQRGKTVELLRRAGKEMYENPIVNTAIGLSPVAGDIQAGVEAYRSAREGDWGNAGLNAVGMLPFIPMLGKTVWHGSPHTFDKFDLSKIGTGEGAQAYGHGLYLAESPEVAKAYRSNLVENPTFVETKTGKLITQDSPDYQDLIDRQKRMERNGYGAEFDKKYQVQEGALYKVDLPDEQIAKMLDYDAPLKDQPYALEKIRSQIDDPDMLKSFDYNVEHGMSGANAYSNWIMGGKTPAMTSQRLNELGVPGLRYLDQGSRANTDNFIVTWPDYGTYGFNTADEAKAFMKEYPDVNLQLSEPTRNYVVFSDEIPQILERNNQPVGMFK